MSNSKAKRSNNFEQKKKGFVPNHIFRNNNTRNFPNKNFQGNKGNSQLNPNGQRNKEPVNNHSNYTKKNEQKEPIKCWECNGPHYASICPNWKTKRNNNFQQKKKEFVPNRNSKNNNTRNFPSISKGTKVIHRPIQIIKEIKNLLTTTIIITRILNKKNQ